MISKKTGIEALYPTGFRPAGTEKSRSAMPPPEIPESGKGQMAGIAYFCGPNL